MNTLKKHLNFLSKKWLAPLVLLSVTMVSYMNVFQTFYQQDEWQSLGHAIAEGWGIVINNLSIFQLFFAEGRVLTRLFYYIFIGLYPFNTTPVFLFAIIFHALNAWLVYLLVKKLNNGDVAAWTAGMFFAANSVADQAVLWVSAVSTIPATTLLLISILYYLDFLETGNKHMRLRSFIIGIGSLLFKETGLIIFVLYPALYITWGKAKKTQDVFVAHRGLLLYGGALVLFRLIELFFAPKAAAGFIDAQAGGFLFPIIYHVVAYPLTSFFQMFVPAVDFYAFVPMVTRSEYPYFIDTPYINLAAQSTVADTVSLLGTIGLGGIIHWMVSVDKDHQKAKKFVLMGLCIVMMSFLPYAVLHKSFSYMSSRYYYVGIIGAALLFGYIISWFFRVLPTLGKLMLAAGVVAFLSHHVWAIHEDIGLQIALSKERQYYIAAIERIHPRLGDKTVFYVTADKTFLGETRYPFQNGLGYILEILYYDTGKIPKEFLLSNFLWDLGSEGYKEAGQYGFGYFESLDRLGERVRTGEIKTDNVYGYMYDSITKQMSDMTPSIREQLATLSATMQ